LRAKQALVVALDAAVTAGEQGRMLTINTVFDALARHWSDHYRKAIEEGPATISYDMKASTVRASWRDLLRNGVQLDALWPKIREGCPGLYKTHRIQGRGRPRGREVELATNNSPRLTKFLQVVEADPDYRRRLHDVHPRLLLANEPLPRRNLPRHVAGEWAYNVATPGRRSLKVIERLEAARFYLNVRAFMKEADRLEQRAKDCRDSRIREYGRLRKRRKSTGKRPARTRARLRTRWQAEKTARAHFAEVKGIRERLQELEGAGTITDGYAEIKSGHYKIVNRRYQPAHFWPVEVTGKDVREELVETFGGEVDGASWEIEKWQATSRRGRLFKAAATASPRLREKAEDDPEYPSEWLEDPQRLAGTDVSSSQLQILAVFLGLEDLEAEVTKRSFWQTLTEHAWQRNRNRRDGFKFPNRRDVKPFERAADPRLREACKKAVMTYLYGSQPTQIAFKLDDDPDTCGPGLGDAANIKRLIKREPVLRTIFTKFLPACRKIADSAYDRDPCAGVVVTDPFDGELVEWNPVRRRWKPVTKMKVYIYEPVGVPNDTGRYAVDIKKLRNMVAPCLVHMLDALFAGLVVEKLTERGIRDVVSVHDAWMVAADAEPALLEAFDAAGEPWLRSLGPVYDDLSRYLKGTNYASWIQECKAKWKCRVAEKRWPRFRATATSLVETEFK